MTVGVLQPAGEAARAIGTVSWVLIVGGFAVLAIVMALLARSLRARAGRVRPMLWLVGGGVLFPGVVVAALFAWSLPMSPAWKPVPPPGALVVAVTGHMWWWEVRYRDPATGADVLAANEIRIPVGRPVYLALASKDVIHSFWVPQLAGKMDMVPGRMQHLLLSADRPGSYRGQCAEFCGEQHALMALHVVALEPAQFDAWLAAQAQPARAARTPVQAEGRDAFLAARCNACHTVRGVSEEARLGPDLTHVGSRPTLAAGTLANTQEARLRWIAHVQQVKPGARMPSYDRLEPRALAAMAEWLGALQ
ncbi:cytochrome c oxidase subunit II [Ramlibacter sp. HM2]|uniref:Cytochrome aa3 subunit 2 n=1 Tax=Ramlibacter pallidus TaxID=2780087 RepID=A0ABR9S3T7_9BURK|nr:cytochrome c oxidase subunit II [Ramlibacter pallidus]MBE7368160.1 cytochrome c oxidase subunit II [Ramlibacter pallidus]